jgi:hypothetical protein
VIRAYLCTVIRTEWERVIHATTASKARYQCLLGLRDSYRKVTLADIKVQSFGDPQTSDSFMRVAQKRGLPFARVGMRVECVGGVGWIVGHNSSCNFEVLMDTGPRKNRIVVVHPLSDVRYFGSDGVEIVPEAAKKEDNNG